MIQVEVGSELAIVALCDASVRLPPGKDQDALVRELEPMARAGRLFYLITDDPLRCRLGFLAGAEPPASLDHEFEPAGGAFGLELPSGKAVVYGWNGDGEPVTAGAVDSLPGAHVLSVFTRRPFDSVRHASDMEALLGADWTYVQRVDKLSLVGCLPLILTAITVAARKWRWLWYVLPLLVLSWLPVLVFGRTRRYRAAQRRASEAEQAHPHFVVSLTGGKPPGLAGGFLRV